MPHPAPFPEQDLRAAIASGSSWADVSRSLGYGIKGANYRTLQRWASRCAIPTDHFDSGAGKRRGNRARMMPLEEAMVENSSYSRGKLKGRLDTHCGRNLPRERTCPACGISFAPHTLRHRYCSKSCLGASNGAHLRGIPHPETRKVERPSYEQLQEELEATNFCAVARKYGVTDNAVRKWVRFYEREQERERSEGAG